MIKKITILCITCITLAVAIFFASCGRRPAPDTRVTSGSRSSGDGGRSSTDRDNNVDRGNNTADKDARRGGGDCKGDTDCENQCDDLFSSRDAQRCKNLTVNEVQWLSDIFDDSNDAILENPDDDELLKILPADLYNLFSIDEDGDIFLDLIEGYSRSDAEDVLYWLASDADIYQTLEELDDEDRDDILEELLSKSKSKITGANGQLLAKLDRGEDSIFVNLAYDEKSEDAYQWMHDYLVDNCVNDVANDDSRDDAYSNITNSEFKKVACALGEFYCLVDEDENYIVDENLFADMVDYDGDLEDYIQDGNSDSTGRWPQHSVSSSSGRGTGLGISDSSDVDDQEEVCRRLCQDSGNNRGKYDGHNQKPSCNF